MQSLCIPCTNNQQEDAAPFARILLHAIFNVFGNATDSQRDNIVLYDDIDITHTNINAFHAWHKTNKEAVPYILFYKRVEATEPVQEYQLEGACGTLRIFDLHL